MASELRWKSPFPKGRLRGRTLTYWIEIDERETGAVKKGFDRARNGTVGVRTRVAVDGEAMAVSGLSFLAANPHHLDRFMRITGLEPATLRRAASSPGFLAAVLDHIVADEPLLIAFAAEAGTDPARVVEAHARLTHDSLPSEQGPEHR